MFILLNRLLTDRNKLERFLIEAGYNDILSYSSPQSTPTPTTNEKFLFSNTDGGVDESGAIAAAAAANTAAAVAAAATNRSKISLTTELVEMPETERFVVELKKDSNGLGITIAGYVCEKEELSGIFVKSVSVGSAADLSGKIQVNDRIVEVDNQSLQGFTNHQAVEVLKKSGTVVSLCLERYLRGPKYEQLQQAIAANELKPQTPSGSGTIFPPATVRSQNSSTQSIEATELTRRPSLTASHGKLNGSTYTTASTVKLSDSQSGLEYDPLAVIAARKLMTTRDHSIELGATETNEPDLGDEHRKSDTLKIDGAVAGGVNVTATVTPEKPKYWVHLMLYISIVFI